MKKNRIFSTQKMILLLTTVIMITAGLLTSACFHEGQIKEVIDIQNTSTNPDNSETGIYTEEWITISDEVKLNELLDFIWQDISSMDIIEYKNSIREASIHITDTELITAISDIVSSFSISNTESMSPTEGTSYEIHLHKTGGTPSSDIFLLIGPSLDGQKFLISGSFIESNNLSPQKLLIQTNESVEFSDVQSIFEPILTNAAT